MQNQNQPQTQRECLIEIRKRFESIKADLKDYDIHIAEHHISKLERKTDEELESLDILVKKL